MIAYSQEISHEWQRRTLLRDFAHGKVPIDAICDADFLLRAAAQFHGTDSARPCPVCERTMQEVLWVYGDKLGRRSGTARSVDEVEALANEVGPISVHVVEVCQHCSWNHLLREVTASPMV